MIWGFRLSSGKTKVGNEGNTPVIFDNLSYVACLAKSLHESMVCCKHKILQVLISLEIDDTKSDTPTLINVHVAAMILHRSIVS